ncbi:MAG: hypothetical protein R6U38_04085 [Desulfatiglandaceae bacterium]
MEAQQGFEVKLALSVQYRFYPHLRASSGLFALGGTVFCQPGLHTRFFWRDPQKREVDLIYTKNSGTFLIEIKIRNKIDKRDIQGLFKFMDKYKLTRGLLVTLDTEASYEKEGRKITALPYWRYWTLDRKVREAVVYESSKGKNTIVGICTRRSMELGNRLADSSA